MKKTPNAFLFLLLIWIPKIQGDIFKIAGGFGAFNGLIPYQVSLRLYTMDHVCGGTIINRNWVVTAAHCIDGADIWYVVAGSVYLNSGGARLELAKSIIYPGYRREGIVNDIGLIKTLQSFKFNPRVRPAFLPTWTIGKKYMMTVSGWGYTNYTYSSPNTLQYLRVLTLDNAECAEALKPFVIYNTTLCTLYMVGKGICLGDSGGPLMLGNQLHGVVSFSRPCALGTPDGYTRVFSFKSWILSTMSTN